MTDLRSALVDCLRSETGFEEQAAALVDRHDLGDVAAPGPPPALEGLDPRDRELLTRVRRFDAGPLGLTLSGPAYQDNPILYANARLRGITGYSLREFRDENPRLLQGPDTEPEAVATLREAIDIWERATVELWNYRRDGTRFRNRVTVVPVPDDSGMISNWLGVQAVVEN